MGKQTVEVVDVPDPKILNSRDAIVKISSTAICGSDLHLYNGLVPTMKKGDVLGHEFMGEVVEVGERVGNRQVGDRVIPKSSSTSTPRTAGVSGLRTRPKSASSRATMSDEDTQVAPARARTLIAF